MDYNSIKGVVAQLLKRNYKQLVAMSFGIFVIILACLSLNLFTSSILFILTPLVIMPFFVSMVVCNMKLKQTGEFENKDFYKNYKVGLMFTMRGYFRIIRNYFQALIGLLGSFIIFYFIPSRVGLINTTTFENLIYDYIQTNSNEAFNALENYIESRDSTIIMVYITYLTGYGLSLMIFMSKIIKHLFIFYIASNFGTDSRESIAIYNKVFPKIKKTYYKINSNFLWYYYVLFPVGFITGVSIVSIWSFELSLLLFGGCLGGLLFCVPMLPLVVTSQDVLFSIFSPYFLVEAREAILKTLKNINNNPQIPEEQKDFLRQYYVMQLKQIDEIKAALNDEVVATVDVNSTVVDDNQSSEIDLNENEESKNDNSNDENKTDD